MDSGNIEQSPQKQYGKLKVKNSNQNKTNKRVDIIEGPQ